ncbi:Small-conductance mechanosensitive channel [Sulfitobacter indolifex]|uniref:Small-conductance mechanosensitive channel n=1 Tax=Sulfitobacter indolifex HEL-45 TaxID=391624 RepID=A0ABM9X8E4_9RHOB|nr:mechanosensitive ion channel family protein [Sulfitobacter indolifex]EDQ05819.1 MscS Mechanosensitive ion channel [Sulfitobacter indolifex HEL-45]UOA19988.1 Small-conductance mechanosensitive channel [Sulfitobacter indolifex]
MRLIAALPRLILCLLLLIALPHAPAVAQTSDQPEGTIAVEGDATADAAIANRIRAILRELEGFEKVGVSVSSGIVTLRGTTLDAASGERLSELAGRVEGVVAIRNEVRESTDVSERLNPAVDRFRDRMEQAVAFLPLALVALGVFALIVVAGLALARLRNPWERLAPNAFIADIYRQIIRLAFIIAALVVALDILGATALLSGILGAAGIVGLAIGFAVRDTVENFIASVMLSIRQPFRPNDTVEIDGDTGKVIRLTSRATILLSYDGNHVRIPNSTVFKSRIINYSRNAERRFTFTLSVASDADLARARDLALEVLNDLHFVLPSPEAAAWVEEVADHWINMQFAGWINQETTDLAAARGEAIRLTLSAFDAAGLTAPPPAYRLITQSESSGTAQRDSPHAPTESANPAPVQTVEAQADRELTRIVAQERAELPREDLLSVDAAEE